MSLSDDDGFDNEDSESFHSFNDSENSQHLNLSVSWKSSLSSDCDSATDFESEHETSLSLEDEYSIEAQPQSPKETPTKTKLGKPQPKSSDQRSECSSDSSAFDCVSNNNSSRQQMGRFKTLKKFTVSPLNNTEEPVPICLRMVPELASKQVPDEELFDLDSPQLSLKNYLTTEQKTPANHENAFTKIWVDWQQDSNEIPRSPLRVFSGALDAYFNPDLTKMTSKKQDDTIVQPVTKPAKTIMAPVTNVKPDKEYVSPFKNMPIQAAPPKETSLLDGKKKPTIVPAGFDVTRLVEFKNPNHWARREHVRTGDWIF